MNRFFGFWIPQLEKGQPHWVEHPRQNRRQDGSKPIFRGKYTTKGGMRTDTENNNENPPL